MSSLPSHWRHVSRPSFAATNSSALFSASVATSGPASPAHCGQPRVADLREEQRAALASLERLEVERDVARTAAERWKAQLAETEAERTELERQLEEAQAKFAAATRSQEEAMRLASALSESMRQTGLDLDRKRSANKELQTTLQRSLADNDRLESTCKDMRILKDAQAHQLLGAVKEATGFEEDLCSMVQDGLQRQEAADLEEKLCSVMGDGIRRQGPEELSKAQVQVLEDRLKKANELSVQLLRQMQHNEIREHRMVHSVQALKVLEGELASQRAEIKIRFDDTFDDVHHEGKCNVSLEGHRNLLQEDVETLRQSLRIAEEQHRAMSENGADDSHILMQPETKVNALLDQVEQSRRRLERLQDSIAQKQRKLVMLEGQSGMLQSELQLALDSRSPAELAAKSATAAQAALEGKQSMLELSLSVGLSAQGEAQCHLRELRAKENALQVDNAFLTSRIKGNEWDLSAINNELERLQREARREQHVISELCRQCQQTEYEGHRLQNVCLSLKAEIEGLRQQDMLDEVGRLKAIVIESESNLIEHLQINDFLIHAQESRTPIPMLIEKMAQVLGLLHNALADAERFCEYAKDSRKMRGRLHCRSQALRQRLQWYKAWKAKVMQRIASGDANAISNDSLRRAMSLREDRCVEALDSDSDSLSGGESEAGLDDCVSQKAVPAPQDLPEPSAKRLPSLLKPFVGSPLYSGSRSPSLASTTATFSPAASQMWSPSSSGMSSPEGSFSTSSNCALSSSMWSTCRNMWPSPSRAQPWTPGSVCGGLNYNLSAGSIPPWSSCRTLPCTHSDSFSAAVKAASASDCLPHGPQRFRGKSGRARQEYGSDTSSPQSLRQSCPEVTLPSIMTLPAALTASDDIEF